MRSAAGLSEPSPAISMPSIGVHIALGRPGAASRPGSGPVLRSGQNPSDQVCRSARPSPVKLQSVVLPGQAIRGRLGALALQLSTLSISSFIAGSPICSLHPFYAGRGAQPLVVGRGCAAPGGGWLPRRTPWTTTWRPTSPACTRPRANRPSGAAPCPHQASDTVRQGQMPRSPMTQHDCTAALGAVPS